MNGEGCNDALISVKYLQLFMRIFDASMGVMVGNKLQLLAGIAF